MARPESTHKASEFKFGQTLVRNIWAGERNPHRTGIFVECVTSQREKCVRCTDGKGEFWIVPVSSVLIYADNETEQSMDARASQLASEQHRIIFGTMIPVCG